MNPTIEVGGTDVTSIVLENSFSRVNALGQRDTLSLALLSPDGTYRPAPGAPVAVNDATEGHLFGGTARAGQMTEAGGGALSSIQCASWEQIYHRRLVGQVSYVDTPAGDVAADLFSRFLGAEDLTASIIVTGPNITVTFDFCYMDEAMDQVCALSTSETDTFMWDLSNRVFRFYNQSSFPAPFDATDTADEVIRPVIVAYSFQDYFNKAFVRVPDFTTDPRTQDFTGDGATQAFDCDLPLALAPAVTLYTRTADLSGDQTFSFTTDGSPAYYAPFDFLNVSDITVSGVSSMSAFGWSVGSNMLTDVMILPAASAVVVTYTYDLGTSSPATVTQTVGIGGVDTGKSWYWNAGSPTITQDAGGTPLPYPDRLSVTYQGQQTTVVDAGQNDAAVAERQAAEGGSGWYMKLIEASKPGILADALALGAAELGKYSTVPFSYEYRTAYGGVRAGMYQRCASSKFGASFDDTFIVESSTLVQEAGQWFWRVRCVNGALGGGWLAKIRKMQQKSAAGLGVTTITTTAATKGTISRA